MFGLPYKLIFIGLAVAFLGFWAMFTKGLIESNGKLKVQLDSAIEIGNANAQAAVDQRAEFDRIQAESVKAAVQKALNRERADQRRKALNNAEDGPLAPVLRLSLDGLQLRNPTPSDTASSPPR